MLKVHVMICVHVLLHIKTLIVSVCWCMHGNDLKNWSIVLFLFVSLSLENTFICPCPVKRLTCFVTTISIFRTFQTIQEGPAKARLVKVLVIEREGSHSTCTALRHTCTGIVQVLQQDVSTPACRNQPTAKFILCCKILVEENIVKFTFLNRLIGDKLAYSLKVSLANINSNSLSQLCVLVIVMRDKQWCEGITYVNAIGTLLMTVKILHCKKRWTI